MSLEETAEALCTALRRRHLQGSLPTARKTAELLRLLFTTKRHADGQQLLDEVRLLGTEVQSAKPAELAIGNIVRRVLHMVREELEREHDSVEYRSERSPATVVSPDVLGIQRPGLLSKMLRHPSSLGVRTISLHNLLDQPPAASQAQPPAVVPPKRKDLPLASGRSTDLKPAAEISETSADDSEKGRRKRIPNWKGKSEVLDQINELIVELDGIVSSIANQALDHMHANEVILTFGHSNTTQLFLIEAAKKRNFQVVVAEGAPEFTGHKLARALADASISTTVIADSAVFAMMARVNKVLMGAHALLANGGVMALAGAHLVALAAKQHSVPFVVLAGLHKLSPLFPHDPSVAFNEFQSPAFIADYDVMSSAMVGSATANDLSESQSVNVHIPNPALDYVPPELISLFITDTGGHTPSYVYRLLTEYYTREDYGLSKELLACFR